MTPQDDEWLDLVNEQDQVIGRMLRSEVYQKNLKNFRSVNLVIVNSKGQLWIPRRALNKRVAPGGLDLSVGGHVISGDTYLETLLREAKEELNLTLTEGQIILLGKLTPSKHGTCSFVEVYELKSDIAPTYNRRDFTEASWLYPKEIIEILKIDVPAKIDLKPVITTFYSTK